MIETAEYPIMLLPTISHYPVGVLMPNYQQKLSEAKPKKAKP